MRRNLGFVYTIIFLQLGYLQCSTENHLDEKCIVKDKQLFNVQEHDSIKITCFITQKDQITIQLSFLEREDFQDNDLLILKPNSGVIQRTEDKDVNIYNLTLTNNITVGWNIISITLQDNKIDIDKFYSHTGFKYKLSELQINAKYLTTCTERTPTWKIRPYNEIVIPLNGLSSAKLKLGSEYPFHPELALNNIDIPLSYEEELIIRQPSTILPPREYQIVIEKIDTKITVYTLPMNGEYSTLMMVKTKEALNYLKISSFKSEILLALDPFHKILNGTHNEMQETDERNSGQMHETRDSSTSNYECDSSTVWKILAALMSVISIMLLAIIIYLVGPRSIIKSIRGNHIEDGEASKPLLNKAHDSVKKLIKSKYTELQQKSNELNNPYNKDVYKLKLKSDKRYNNKKLIDDLDDKKENKTILVVGETGSGKSSFINSMINFIYGVAFTDRFRFKLIDDMDKPNASYSNKVVDINDESNAFRINSNDEIQSYYIPFIPGMIQDFNYIFIDTPGFGDARGVDEDKKWNQKFYEFLNRSPDINQVDGICFVIRSSDTRLTSIQRYIIAGLFSMFGKDIQNNIYVVVSYSDNSETHAPKLLEESGLSFKLALNFNSNGLYNDIKINKDSPNYFMNMWDMNMKNIGALFDQLKDKSAVSLLLTTLVLEEKINNSKIIDELLNLVAKENDAEDQEKQDIRSRIEENQELLMMKLDEAQKLSGRLEKYPCKEDPLAINEYLDMLLKTEENDKQISDIQKLKKRNETYQNLLKEKKPKKNLLKYIFGEKTEKTE